MLSIEEKYCLNEKEGDSDEDSPVKAYVNFAVRFMPLLLKNRMYTRVFIPISTGIAHISIRTAQEQTILGKIRIMNMHCCLVEGVNHGSENVAALYRAPHTDADDAGVRRRMGTGRSPDAAPDWDSGRNGYGIYLSWLSMV
jgi:hypothetical protein